MNTDSIKNRNIKSFYGTAVMSEELQQFHNSIYGSTPRGPYGVLQLKGYHVMGGYVGLDARAPKSDQIYLSDTSITRKAHNRSVRQRLYDGLENTLNPRLNLTEAIGYDSGNGTRIVGNDGIYRPLGKDENRNVEPKGTDTYEAKKFLIKARKTLLEGGNADKPLRTHAAAKLMTEATRLAYTPEMKFRRNFPMAHRFAKKFILGLCPTKLTYGNQCVKEDCYKFLGKTLLTTPLTPSDKPKPIGLRAARDYVLVDVKPLADAGLQNQNGQLCVFAKWEDICARNKGKITQGELRGKQKYVSVVPAERELRGGNGRTIEVLELKDVTAKMRNRQNRTNVFLHGANRENLRPINTQPNPQPNPMMNANRGNRRPNPGDRRFIDGVRCIYVAQAMTERQSGWYNVQTNELVRAE